MSIWVRLTKEQVSPRDAGVFLVVAVMPVLFAPITYYPFVNTKLPVLLLGVLLIALSRPAIDRMTALIATMWVAALTVTGLVGLDPWWSLFGAEHQGTGIVTLSAAAFLMCIATRLDTSLRERVPHWLFWTGVLVAGVAVVARFWQFGFARWRMSPFASTIGHRVFVGGFLAAAAIAAITIRRRPAHYAGLVVLGSGLSVSSVRSAWIGALLGVAVIGLKHRSQLKPIATTVAPIVVAIGIWTVVTPLLPRDAPELGYSAVQRFGALDEGSALERPQALRTYLRGWSNEPLFGTGPGTGWHVFLKNATENELRVAGRGFADAHNVVIELGATTGVVGVLPLVGLAVLTLARLRRATPDRAWALGAAIALGVVHLFQPLNVVLTPLLFFTAGLAARSPEQDGDQLVLPTLWAVPVVILLALSMARFLAASFDLYGKTYASESAYRWALRLEPRRLETTLRFADHRAFDYRTGDEAAGREAKQLVYTVIAQHGWNPRVRGAGVNVMMVLDDVEAAQALVEEQLRIFPNDGEAIASLAALALRRGDTSAAEQLVRRALQIFPDSPVAGTVRDQLASRRSEPEGGKRAPSEHADDASSSE